MASSTSSPFPAAVLWDMDGTLVDTEPYWMRAEIELVESFGGTWTPQDAMTIVGTGLMHAAGVLQDRGVRLEREQIVERLTDRMLDQLTRDGAPWRPGARELIDELKLEGIPMALVTMSLGRLAAAVISSMSIDAFDVIVTGDLVNRPKPHPEPYLQAASQLGVVPTETIAIEDSVNGVTAASAAGAVTIGVPHVVELPASDGYTIWPTLEGVRVADLRSLAERIRA